jgi:hypothetical protein
MKPLFVHALSALALLGTVLWWVQDLLLHPIPAVRTPVSTSDTRLPALDAAFELEWQRLNLTPTARADYLTLMRRISLALTGSIPSLQEIRDMEAAKPHDGAAWWTQRLLNDRRSSDYLAERLVRVYVGIENGPFLVYRRRRLVEWLSEALSKNRRYDEIAQSLIAATGVWTTRPEVNFLTVTNENKKGPDEAKLAARVSRAFLGVQLDCVQCHDGKLGSTWKQTDFHRLASYFGQANINLTGLRDNPKQVYQVRYLGRAEEEKVPSAVPWGAEWLPEKGTPRQQLATWVTAKENLPFARTLVNRIWALLMNRPLVSPVDDIPLDGPFPPGLEVLADDLIAHDFDLHRLIQVITSSQVFRLSSQSADPGHPVTAEAEAQWAAFPITRLRPEQMAGSVVQAASLTTIDDETPVLLRLKRSADVANFVRRYGDSGEDTFEDTGGTIPQRLLLMNGNMVTEHTKNNPALNASTRIAFLAPDNQTAVEVAYLSALTRRPTAAELAHFVAILDKAKSTNARANAMADLCWTLLNATEFSWNH